MRQNAVTTVEIRSLLPAPTQESRLASLSQLTSLLSLSQGLSVFPKELYDVIPREEANGRPAHALMLRSHKLQEDQVDPSVRGIARCGAGTNNIPVARMTELGIPVFNTPGANANAVKELVLCGLLLGSRRVIDGINHMKDLGKQGLARERVEKVRTCVGLYSTTREATHIDGWLSRMQKKKWF